MRFSRPEHKNYLVLMALCLAGYAWLTFNVFTAISEDELSVDVCLIKQLSGMPCPSCGTTRAILALMDGNITEALLINPLGILAATFLLLVPLWIFFDLLFRKTTLLSCYTKLEQILVKRVVAIPLILLVVLNWIWNITKGL